MIQRLEQGARDSGSLASCRGCPAPRARADSRTRLIGTLASLRASLTYVTGSHSLKFGYQGGFGNPSQTYQNYTQVVQVRT